MKQPFSLAHRLPALKASGWHLLASVLLAGLAALLVFVLWYPGPYSALSGGRDLFFILITVDVLCGPLLTLVLFNPRKRRRVLATDLCLVALVQLAALAYGVNTMALARPVLLAFEKDRFRVLAPADIALDQLPQAPAGLRTLSLTGPQLIGVRVADPADADYLAELDRAMSGQDAAQRPARWVPYADQRTQVLAAAKPWALLVQKFPDSQAMLARTRAATGLPDDRLLWLPVRGYHSTAWVALLDKKTAQLVGFAPFDGF